MALIDEVQDDGTINTADTASYSAKTPSILNILQAELIKQGDLYNTHEISNYPIVNQLGDHFDIVEFDGVTDITFEAIGSKAWYIEVDGPCTIHVEENTGAWTSLASQVVPTTVTKFTAYKGSLNPSSTSNKVRIRVTGSYYVRTKNRALFEQPFYTVPDYRPFVKKQMPSDFYSVDQIVEETADSYNRDATYKWEGKKDLYMDWNFNGNLRIVYRAIPTEITSLSDTLQLDDVTCIKVLPYGLAAHLMLDENQDAAAFFQQRYEEMKREQYQEQPAAENEIEDIYGITTGMG